MNTPQRRRIILVLWLAGLGLALTAFLRSGPSPAGGTGPMLHPGTWAASDPMALVAGVARLAGIAILSYLLAATALQLLAARSTTTARARFVRRVTPRFLVVMTAGVLVSSGSAFASTGVGPSGGRASPPVMQVVPSTSPQPSPEPVPSTNVDARTSLPWAGDRVVTSEPLARPADGAPIVDPLVIYRVEPGDHLWSIARTEVEHRLGGDPTDTQVAGYWSQLIESNRDRLVDPDNIDLILPGQELVLPF